MTKPRRTRRHMKSIMKQLNEKPSEKEKQLLKKLETTETISTLPEDKE